MTGRHPQWEQRLGALIEGGASRPYVYGKWDCVMFPVDAAKAVTGKDHGRGHRGKYSTAAGAARYLKKLGFDSPEAALDSLFAEKPAGFAQRGDLVLCRTGSGDNPGVCMGAHALVVGVARSPASSGPPGAEVAGLIRVPRDLWLKAWAVGDV